MNSAASKTKIKFVLAELLAVISLIIITALPFAPALSPGHTLSKLSLIKEIDYLQRGDLDGYIEISSDPSASICHAPNEVYASKNSNGFPLWNQDSGCGRPVIGDFQTLLFSFFHRYFPVADNTLNTLGILFKILTAALGAYTLARVLGISRISSLAAGIAFALSPRCLFFAELCNNYCFYPWMMTCAIWATSKMSFHRSALFALVLAAGAYNMHPETFVIGTGTALVLAFLRLVAKPENNDTALGVRSLKSALWTSAIGALSFLLAAPLVIPFCEFILNGVSYKFDSASSTQIDFTDIFTFFSNLSVPLFSASPCIGPVLALLFLPGLILAWRKNKELVVLFIATLLFSTRPGPLEGFFAVKPISFLLPEYSIYVSILMCAIFGAFGLDVFVSPDSERHNELPRKTLAACGLLMMLSIATLWVLQSPWFAEFWSDKTDWGYTNQSIDSSFSLLGLAVMTLVVVFSFARMSLLKRLSPVLSVFFLAANSIPLTLFSSAVIPNAQAFWYKQDPVISKLKDLQKNNEYRSTATGCFIFQPNTNLIFGTSDFRSTAPLHPRRYAKFIELAGIRSKYCNIYESPSELNNLFDLASVKYIISNLPVHSKSLLEQKAELGEAKTYSSYASQKLVPGIRFLRASLEYYPAAHELKGRIVLTVHEHASRHNIYRIVLLDAQGKRLWPSPLILEPLENFGKKQDNHSWELPITAPLPVSYKGKFSVTLQVGQYVNGQLHGPQIVLANIDTDELTAKAASGRIVRVADSGNYLQVYENRKVLPPAYIVHQIRKSSDEKQSLELLRDQNRDYTKEAIIEGTNLAEVSTPLGSNATKELVQIAERDSDSVTILAQNRSAGYLVLTDTYYPGWRATVDGKAAPLYPANYAFRAVYLPTAGRHQIRFVYKPQSFDWGCRLMTLGLLVSCFCLLLDLGRQLARRKRIHNSLARKEDSALEDYCRVQVRNLK